MNNPKPNAYVAIVALMSEQLVQAEATMLDLRAHITADHAEMDEMQRTITDLRTQAESKYDELDNLRTSNQEYSEKNWRLQNQVYDLESKVGNHSYLTAECERLREEVLTLKYGNGTPEERASAYMKAEGESVLRGGNRILCIKGVKECTRWGLKEAKDYVEAYKLPTPTIVDDETPSGTKRSQDLARSA